MAVAQTTKRHHSSSGFSSSDSANVAATDEVLYKGGSFHQDHHEGAQITFNIELLVNFIPTSQLSLIPFVEFPNGKALEGSPILITATTPIPFSLPPLIVNCPLYGTYHVGVSIFDTTLVIGDELTMNYVVAIARDNIQTVLPSKTFSSASFNTANGLSNQLTADFTYSPLSDLH